MRIVAILASAAACAVLPGCLLLVGAGIGAAAVGAVVATRDDSAEVILERSPDAVRQAAREILIFRGVLTKDGPERLEAEVEKSSVVVTLSEPKKGQTKIVVSARKILEVVPNQALAKDIARDIANATMRADYPHTI
ncbi:MAG: hypothetical protein JXP34_06385 [Planctomycetes bacterium]|nr:hypothetical protein [Planctomycetota bacterium]